MGKLLFCLNFYFRELLPVDVVWSWLSCIYHEFRDILRNIKHNYLLLLLSFRPSFTLKFFVCLFVCLFVCFVRTGYPLHDISDISSSLDLSKTFSLRWLTKTESNSQSSHLELLSPKFSSRPCPKFRGGNDERNGTYSSSTEVISDAILFIYRYLGPSQKLRACHTRWHNFF